MPLPRFRIRTLMIAVAVVGVALGIGIWLMRAYERGLLLISSTVLLFGSHLALLPIAFEIVVLICIPILALRRGQLPPRIVIEAATYRVPGLDVRRVSRKIVDGAVVWQVEGAQGGLRWVLYVSPLGENLLYEPLGPT